MYRKEAPPLGWKVRLLNRTIWDIGEFIFVEDRPETADAIMVVGGSYPELTETAADLWKKNFAARIFIGGGFSIKTGKFPGPLSKRDMYQRNYETEYDFYKDVLLLNGVDGSAILGENRSTFTRENAVFARQVADENRLGLRKALLVCKAFHARRSLMFYQAAFPETDFLVIPCAVHGITKRNWFQTEYGVQRVLGELGRCGSQFDTADINRFLR